MGRSISATFAYGFRLSRENIDESPDLPWLREDSQWEEEIDWWQDVKGMTIEAPYPYDEHGNHTNPPALPSVIEAYWDEVLAWRNANPIPVRFVYSGIEDWRWPTVLAVSANRFVSTGPHAINYPPPAEQWAEQWAETIKATLEFADTYGIEIDSREPGWFLCLEYG